MTSPLLIRSTLTCLAAIFLPLRTVFAQDAVTAPRGYYTVKVPGSTAEAPQVRTYIGVQLMPATRFMGLVSTVTGDTFSCQGSPDHTAPHDPARTSYVHVMKGSGRGFVVDINQFRTSDIVCAENLVPWIEPGAQVRIRPHPHISDLLGATNRFGLGAGTDADAADNVVGWDPQTQQERVYYFHSTRQRWEEKDIVADAGDAIFRFPYGFYIVRRSPGMLRISLSGEIGSDAILLPVRPGNNVFSLPVNLSASLDKILRGDGQYPVISGPNATSADILTFEEPTTGFQRGPFYHLSRAEETGWREVGVDDSTAPIQPIDFLSTLILRRGGDAGHVLAEGSLEPPANPAPPLPADPEPGEEPLIEEFPIPGQIPPGVILAVEISTDLQTWAYHATPERHPGKLTFTLPAGQGRAFYRIKAILVP